MAYIPKQKKKKWQPKPIKRFGVDPFYNSTRWRKISKAWKVKHPICQVCAQRPTQITDHVVSRNVGGAEYDSDNFLGMCHIDHNKKRGLERHTNIPLIETKESSIEDKLVPVDKNDIIELLNKKQWKTN